MSILSGRKAYWSATLPTADISTATLIGTLAPGTELPDVEIMTGGSAFGIDAAVGASIAPTLMVYGATPLAAIVTAVDANPPTYGYLVVTGANGEGLTWYHVHPNAAYAVPRQNDRQRVMCAYAFYGEADTPADLTANVTGELTLPT